MEMPAAGCKLPHFSGLIPPPPNSIIPVFICSFVSKLTMHPRPPRLISYICHRLLSANGLLMPPVKTCRGGVGPAPACPRTGDFPALHRLFLLQPEEQKQKHALHHSHCTVFCLPMKKCEANSWSSVPIFTQDTVHTMGQYCELAHLFLWDHSNALYLKMESGTIKDVCSVGVGD